MRFADMLWMPNFQSFLQTGGAPSPNWKGGPLLARPLPTPLFLPSPDRPIVAVPVLSTSAIMRRMFDVRNTPSFQRSLPISYYIDALPTILFDDQTKKTQTPVRFKTLSRVASSKSWHNRVAPTEICCFELPLN